MIEIKYDDRQVLDALQELSRRMDDMTPVMRDIAGVMEDATERAFENETDQATGLAWRPLKASTVKMRGGDAHPILQRSGQLASLKPARRAGFKRHFQ
ncbi:MAG: phage virion morphogenesis protein [Pseudomonadota bacterium]